MPLAVFSSQLAISSLSNLGRELNLTTTYALESLSLFRFVVLTLIFEGGWFVLPTPVPEGLSE